VPRRTLGERAPGTAANSRFPLRASGITLLQPSAGPKAEATGPSMGGSVYRSRTLRAAQLAAQPTARYRPGRNMRPALASSRVAGCRAALRTASRAFAGSLTSRTRAARSLTTRRATSRRIADRVALMISARVSGNVPMPTTRANVVSDGIETDSTPSLRPLFTAQPSARRVAESTMRFILRGACSRARLAAISLADDSRGRPEASKVNRTPEVPDYDPR
jgi:hypothetical protein